MQTTLHLKTLFLASLAIACSPQIDPPPIELPSCPNDSPTELARFDYEPQAEYRTFDLVDAVTVAIDTFGEGPTYIVDNCGGPPVRIRETFGYRPGAARVGGDIVLCGAGLGGPEGVWQLLENGTSGKDLGLGHGCPDWVNSWNSPAAALSAYGLVWDDGKVVQHRPDGTTREMPVGVFHRVGESLVVLTREGEVAVAPPGDADTVYLDLPDPILSIQPTSDEWAVLVPSSADEEGHVFTYYALDTTTGEWFSSAPTATLSSIPPPVDARDGLSATWWPVERVFEFQRPLWDGPLATDFSHETRITIVDREHVYLVERDTQLLIRVPMEFPAEGEPANEVVWTRDVGDAERPPDGLGNVWRGLVIDGGQAYPVDGSDPYPFLPQSWRVIRSHRGDEFFTALVRDDDSLQLVRIDVQGNVEVIDRDILEFMHGPWSPELGRLVYAVRDGDEVSIRQHRLGN